MISEDFLTPPSSSVAKPAAAATAPAEATAEKAFGLTGWMGGRRLEGAVSPPGVGSRREGTVWADEVLRADESGTANSSEGALKRKHN